MTASSLEPIVRSVLVVARLGEIDHHGWSGTRSFGAAGRVVLKQKLPRTWRMAAIELDMLAAANRHNEIIDRPNAVHLFSDNWALPRWAKAWVSEQKTSVPPNELFEHLETASTEELIGQLRGEASRTGDNGRAFKLGSISRSKLDTPEDVVDGVLQLAAAYPALGDSFSVPYFDIEG